MSLVRRFIGWTCVVVLVLPVVAGTSLAGCALRFVDEGGSLQFAPNNDTRAGAVRFLEVVRRAPTDAPQAELVAKSTRAVAAAVLEDGPDSPRLKFPVHITWVPSVSAAGHVHDEFEVRVELLGPGGLLAWDSHHVRVQPEGLGAERFTGLSWVVFVFPQGTGEGVAADDLVLRFVFPLPANGIAGTLQVRADLGEGTFHVPASCPEAPANDEAPRDAVLALADDRSGERTTLTSGRPGEGATAASLGLVALVAAGALARSLQRAASGLTFAWPFLFTRLSRSDARSHPRREQILEYVRRHPGVRFHEIKKDLDLPDGVLVHHLRTPERERWLVAERHGRSLRLRLPDQRVPEIRSQKEAALLRLIADRPGLTAREAGLALDWHAWVATYWARRLASRGDVTLVGRYPRRFYRAPRPGA